MKILYIAPRYHTNQIPIIEGWIGHGDQVLFISQVTNNSEDHTVLKPVVLGYSKIFNLYLAFRNKWKGQVLPDEQFAFSSKKGFPPYGKLRKVIKEFSPDAAILRERSVYTMIAFFICKRYRIPSILYNQSPFWDNENIEKKKRLKFLFPQVRITPVLGVQDQKKEYSERVYYVPFVMRPFCNSDEKSHFYGDKVQIVCVAGYHERKCLPMLLSAMALLKEKYSIHLCIIGEVITEDQEQYYHYLVQYAKDLFLDGQVTFCKNFKREQVFAQYKLSDLFVLPSTRERASISQLEAMSCSLPVICSDTNGTACQIEYGINGYLFRDGSLEDLKDKIEMAIKDRSALVRMGQAAYDGVCRNHSFEVYYQILFQILNENKRKRIE